MPLEMEKNSLVRCGKSKHNSSTLRASVAIKFRSVWNKEDDSPLGVLIKVIFFFLLPRYQRVKVKVKVKEG